MRQQEDMKKLWQGKYFYLIVGMLVLIMVGVILLVIGLGRAYRGSLSILDTGPQDELTLTKKKKINRITARRSDESGCIEVTPDGVVRVYEECGGELVSANRLVDPKNILKLFQLSSERNLTTFPPPGQAYYELTLETDEGTETVYIAIDGGDDEVIETIENIEGDIPQTTPTPVVTPSPPKPTPTPSPGSTPPPPASPQPSATPTTGGETGGTFTCDFSEGGIKVPYRVSGVVCTTEPSPIP